MTVDVLVQTTEGDYHVEWFVTHTVAGLLGEVLGRQRRRLDGTYDLVTMNGDVLDPHDTFAEAGYEAGDRVVLTLQANPAGGI